MAHRIIAFSIDLGHLVAEAPHGLPVRTIMGSSLSLYASMALTSTFKVPHATVPKTSGSGSVCQVMNVTVAGFLAHAKAYRIQIHP